MENQNGISQERFKVLIEHAQKLLNMSSCEFKYEYSESIRHIAESPIDTRINEEGVTMSCFVNDQKRCTDVYFFFDRIEDEDAFIDHLVDYVDYSFRKRAWSVFGCNIRTKEMENILTFHFTNNFE